MTDEEKKAKRREHYLKNRERICAERREYRVTHKERVKEINKRSNEKNKEKIGAYKREYNKQHREEKSQYNKEYTRRNKERLTVYAKEYYDKNGEMISAKRKQYYHENKERLLSANKKWVEDNREYVAAYNKKWRTANADWIRERSAGHRERNKERFAAINKAWRSQPMVCQNPDCTETDPRGEPGQKYCCPACFVVMNSGDKCYMWREDKVRTYAPEFNNQLKKAVKDRDGHMCQMHEDLLPEPMCIHHINYDPLNPTPELVLLCSSCHGKTTHGNREIWIRWFHEEWAGRDKLASVHKRPAQTA